MGTKEEENGAQPLFLIISVSLICAESCDGLLFYHVGLSNFVIFIQSFFKKKKSQNGFLFVKRY